MDKYKLIKKLGDGSFGVVYKATHLASGETVAIKKFKQKYTNWDECIELREVKSLRKLSHRNLIKLREVLQVADEFYMVFEYLEYNLLELYAKSKENNKRLTEHEIKYAGPLTQEHRLPGRSRPRLYAQKRLLPS